MGNSSKSKLRRQEKEENFKFGFNNFEFSDRTLRLEIAEAETNDVKVQTFCINSFLFAAKSPFFSKLLNNSMKASSDDKETVSLRISESEETGFMDLLNSMYRKPLKAGGSWSGLVDVLTVADKFVVPSCITDCVELLLHIPMTMDRALFCMELPYMVFSGLGFEPLKEQVHNYLITQFRDFTESRQQEAMAFPLWVIEGILGSKDLQITTEDAVFQFILKWARFNYPKLEERQPVVRMLSARFVCLWRMGSEELKGATDCPDMGGDSEEMIKQLLQALVISQGSEAEDQNAGYSRVYARPLVKVVQLNCPLPRCVVFLDLPKQQCLDTFPSTKQVSSTTFRLGGRSFLISTDCNRANSSFDLYLHLVEGSESCTVDVDFAAINKKFNLKFKRLIRTNFVLTPDMGMRRCFRTPCNQVVTDYSIDGILHFRLELTIVS